MPDPIALSEPRAPLLLSKAERFAVGFSRLARDAALRLGSFKQPSLSEIDALASGDPEGLGEKAPRLSKPSLERAWLCAIRLARSGDERALIMTLESGAALSPPFENPKPAIDEALHGPARDLLGGVASFSASQEALLALAQARLPRQAEEALSQAIFLALCQLERPERALHSAQARANAARELLREERFGGMPPKTAIALANARDIEGLARFGLFDSRIWRRDLRHSRSLAFDASSPAGSFVRSLLTSEAGAFLLPGAGARAARVVELAGEATGDEAWLAKKLEWASRSTNPGEAEFAIEFAMAFYDSPPPEIQRSPRMGQAFEARDISVATLPAKPAPRRFL